MCSFNARKIAVLLATLALHATLLNSMIGSTAQAPLDMRTRRERPLTASLFFLREPGAVHLEGYTVASTTELQTITLPIPELPEIDAVAADSFERADLVASTEDLAAVEKLQGIYVKQIADRITRLLQMATSTPEDVSGGRCIIHIIQNEGGNVLDVDTDECEREPVARDRLANAIRAASPLPPPPQGLAMGSYLTIDASTL